MLQFLPNPDADTIRILEHVSNLNETGILQSLDRSLTKNQVQRLYNTQKALSKDTPLEYITGLADFHGRKFFVSPYTLIPRIETEMLVDLAVGYAMTKSLSNNSRKPIAIADVGTGSGCIIISTALSLRGIESKFLGTDISDHALTVAKRNARTYGLGKKIHFLHGNLLDPTGTDELFDIIVANLPYVKKCQMTELPPSVKNFEPHVALDGGENGTTLIREFLVQAADKLHSKGVLLLEAQAEVVPSLISFARRFYPKAKIGTLDDTFGTERYITIET